MKDDFAEAAETEGREHPEKQEETAAPPKKPLPILPILTGTLKKLPSLRGGRPIATPPGQPLREMLRPAWQGVVRAAGVLRRFFKKDSLPNLVLVMVLLTVVAAAGLGAVHTAAQPRIEAARAGRVETAMSKVFPGQELYFIRSSLGENIYEGRGEQGALAGFAILVSPKGDSGPVDMVVGVDMRREVTGVEVVARREPGGHSAAIEQGIKEALASFDREVQQPLD